MFSERHYYPTSQIFFLLTTTFFRPHLFGCGLDILLNSVFPIAKVQYWEVDVVKRLFCNSEFTMDCVVVTQLLESAPKRVIFALSYFMANEPSGSSYQNIAVFHQRDYRGEENSECIRIRDVISSDEG